MGFCLSFGSVEILQAEQVVAAFHGLVPAPGEERFGSFGEGAGRGALRALLHRRAR